jgi:hypothetical protein
MTLKNKTLFIQIAFLITGVMVLILVSPAYGQGLHDYYGGSIQKVTYCTCYYDFGVMLEIKDLSRNGQTVTVFYSPYRSRLRANYNIWTAGPNVIGGYTIGNKECKKTSGYTCSSQGTSADGTIDFIRGIGSSSS